MENKTEKNGISCICEGNGFIDGHRALVVDERCRIHGMTPPTDKPELPMLFVRGNVSERPDGQYVLAWFERQHDTEHTYIPAERIRELIEESWVHKSLLDLQTKLESLIGTEEP